MSDAQKRALENYRSRLAASGMARFEVLGMDRDRDLIRSLARRLAANDAGAQRLRKEIGAEVGEPERATGGVLAALRRSPLVGVDLDLTRNGDEPRDIDL